MLLCSTALAAATAVAQQDAPPPPPQGQGQWHGGPDGRGPGGSERRLEMLEHRLNLSADQTTQIKTIFADGRTKMEALRSNMSLAPQDRHLQSESLRKDETAKVEAVLTADQKSKFEEMEAHERERRMEHRGPGGPGGPNGEPPPPPPPSPSL